MQFSNNTLEDLQKTIKLVLAENKKLKNEQEALRKKVTHLQVEIDKLKAGQKGHEESDRQKNLVLMGLQSDGIRDTEAVKKLLSTLNIDTTDGEYTVKTLPSKMPSKPILIKLSSKSKRDEILVNRKAKGKITSTELGLPGEERPVFVNEDLPMDLRLLHNRARMLKYHNFKHIWVRDGKVLCRQSDSSKVIRVENCEQVESLKHKAESIESKNQVINLNGSTDN